VAANGREIDNQWVVLYKRDLCVKYDSHINVKHVAVYSVVKYLYRYVHKGHNHAIIIIEDNTTHRDCEQTWQDR